MVDSTRIDISVIKNYQFLFIFFWLNVVYLDFFPTFSCWKFFNNSIWNKVSCFLSEMSITVDNLPLPRWYSEKCFDFQGCNWFKLKLLLLINQICWVLHSRTHDYWNSVQIREILIFSFEKATAAALPWTTLLSVIVSVSVSYWHKTESL